MIMIGVESNNKKSKLWGTNRFILNIRELKTQPNWNSVNSSMIVFNSSVSESWM